MAHLHALGRFGETALAQDGVNWVWIVVVVLLALACLVVIGAVTATVVARQKSSGRKTCRVEVTNQGNVRSRYRLQAETPGGGLRFSFLQDGALLPGQSALAPASRTNPAAAPTTPAARPAARRERGQGFWQSLGIGTMIASVLTTLGSLLPYSAGQPLLQLASKIHQGTAQVRHVSTVSGQVNRAVSRSPAPGQPAAPAAAPQTTGADGGQESVESEVGTGWAETGFVEPNRTLAIDLILEPTSPGQAQHYPFSVTSYSVEDPAATEETQEGRIQINTLSPAQRLIPVVAGVAAGLVVLLIAGVLIATGL